MWAQPRTWGHGQGPWMRGQDRGGEARGRGGAAKTVEERPGAVGVRPRSWGRGQGSKRCSPGRGQDSGARSGVVGARPGGRGDVAKTVQTPPGAVGARSSPCGHGQVRRGAALAVEARPRAVGARPRPWGRSKGPWGHGQERVGAATGCGSTPWPASATCSLAPSPPHFPLSSPVKDLQPLEITSNNHDY